MNTSTLWASQVALGLKTLPASIRDARDVGLIPGSGRSPGEGNGNLPQYSCLENPGSLVEYSPWGHKESFATERLVIF